MSWSKLAFLVSASACLAAVDAVTVTQSATKLHFASGALSLDFVKSNGYIQNITFEGVSLLGAVSGNAGQAYTDWPSYQFGLVSPSAYQLVQGADYAGLVYTDNNTAAGSLVQRAWFLRDGENGLHSFVRMAYYNSTYSPGALGESRTMFRPNNALGASPWTHIVTDDEQWAPIPSQAAQAAEVQVQDATWWLGNTPGDAYVQQEAEYWTKYTFAANQSNKAHGLYGTAPDGSNVGAWWVVNQKDAFFGGPLHVDLMVDGIAYNKQSTSHGGATSPPIVDGFDRTFGPQFLYFNRGTNASLLNLLADAQRLSDPTWDADFYDEIAPHVPGYVPSSLRGTFTASVKLPAGAQNASAVLSASGYHFQDSASDPSAYQYWADIVNGTVTIPRVKAGTYRLTVYAKGIFGDYVEDGLVIDAGKTLAHNVTWTAETAGTELWRIGTPDKTSGEFANGFERDLTHPRAPAKYRIYWGAWDYPTQFPDGINFVVGKSNELTDWNYVHWSQFGPTHIRNDTVININTWNISFPLTSVPSASSTATFTMQLAGAHTTSGNTDDPTAGSNPTFPISVYVNNITKPLQWTIQANESSSCAVRSAISCHLLANKFTFPGTWLQKGNNTFQLALPYNTPVYVQYDALRLELD